MNAKFRAKHRSRRAGALVLSVWLIPQTVTADDGNLTQQLHIQQHKSRFQLMLEQVQGRARQRAAAGQTATSSYAGSSVPTDLGDWTQSMRLHPVTVNELATPQVDPDNSPRLWAQQTYERDQQRTLDHRQQRRALIAGARTRGAIRANSFQAKRRELVRFDAQNQRQSLQRKLRR